MRETTPVGVNLGLRQAVLTVFADKSKFATMASVPIDLSPRSAPVRAPLYTAEQRSRRDVEIDAKLAALQSEWVLGKRMERHIARSQGVPFARNLGDALQRRKPASRDLGAVGP